jgi:hypothetical protein
MNTITTSAELKAAIHQLELEQKESFIALKEEFGRTQENFKLINIVKSAFKAAVDVPDLKTDIVNTAIGLTSGMLAKKLIIGKTFNPLSKLLGVALEMFVANKVTKNADDIKSAGSTLVSKLFNRKTETKNV